MEIYKKFVAGLLLVLTVASCAKEQKLPFEVREIEAYPFYASRERIANIKDNYTKVSIGMSSIDVIKIVGQPDEIRPTYEAVVKNGKLIGYSYWYVLRRLVRDGSQLEKNESLVRISFNINGKVVKINNWIVD